MSTAPTVNCTTVTDEPSVTVEIMCQTPGTLETASSTFFVTCDSSSDGAAPDWVTTTCTIGMSMLGNLVTAIWRNATMPSSVRMTKPTAAGIGRRIDQAETLSLTGSLPRMRRGRRVTRSPGRRNAAARATTISPAATPPAISSASPSATPTETRRCSTIPSRTTSARAPAASRSTALAGTPTPWLRDEHDLGRGEAADMGRRAGCERDAHLAGAARLVDLGADQPHRSGDLLRDAGKGQLGAHADGEARQGLLGRFGFEIDRAVLDDAEQRLARAADRRAEPRSAAADDSRDRRLHLGLSELDLELAALAVARLAVGFGDRERVLSRGELGASGAQSGLALLDRRRGDDLRAELGGAVVIVAGPRKLRLGLFDRALGLSDRRVGARRRRVVLGDLGVDLAAIEPREHLAGGDGIAFLGVDLDDRQPVDLRRDLRLLARDQRAGDEQSVDERPVDGGDDGHRRRRDRARGFRGARAGATRGAEAEAGERGERRRARRDDKGDSEAADQRDGAERGNENATHQVVSGRLADEIAPANRARSRAIVIVASASTSKRSSRARRRNRPPT